MRWYSGSNVIIVRPFLLPAIKLKFSSCKNGVWPIGYFPIAMSALVAFDQYQYNKTDEKRVYYTRNVQNPACWFIQADKSYCLTSLLWHWSCNDWFNQLNETLGATVAPLFYQILNISLKKLPAHFVISATKNR